MQAIEFVTKAKNGKTIEIPKEFLNEISGEFRVILLLEKKTESSDDTSKKREFKAFKTKTKDLKFNREEIYDE